MISECSTVNEYKSKLSESGDCNTGLCLIDPNATIDCKVVVIDSDEKRIVSCINWAHKTYGGDIAEVGRHVRAMAEINRDIKGMHVSFNDIDCRAGDIYKYLTGLTIDKCILQAYNGMKIETKNFTFDKKKTRLLLDDVQRYKTTH